MPAAGSPPANGNAAAEEDFFSSEQQVRLPKHSQPTSTSGCRASILCVFCRTGVAFLQLKQCEALERACRAVQGRSLSWQGLYPV